MPIIERTESTLVVVDVQARLMPAIANGERVVQEIGRLLDIARRLGVAAVLTEQNPAKLGPTVAGLGAGGTVLPKMSFDATRDDGLLDALPPGSLAVVTGCEAHVCVLQTVLGLLKAGRRVAVVRDAVGSRRDESREAAIRRMERHGAEIVTAEMVIFEWLQTCEDEKFREIVALVK